MNDAAPPTGDRTQRRFSPTPLGIMVMAVGIAAGLFAKEIGVQSGALGGAAVFAAVPLAFVLLAAWRALTQLRHVACLVRVPQRVFAGRPFALRVRLASRVGVASDVVVACGNSPRAWRDLGYAPELRGAPGCAIDTTYRIGVRGRVDRLWLRLRSTFPFGLFESVVLRPVAVDLLVLPVVLRLRGLEGFVLRAARNAGSRSRVPCRGDEEFHALRHWRPGESRRRIAWKASARRETPVMREHERPRLPPVCVVLDNAPDPRTRDYELAVSLTASLVHALHRRGHRVRLVIAGSRSATELANTGPEGCMPQLAALALVRREPGPPQAPPRPAAREVLFVVRAGSDVPPKIATDAGGPGGAARPSGQVAPPICPRGAITFDVGAPATRRWLTEVCGILLRPAAPERMS